MIGRPRGRPFAKGRSGNPGGRPIRPKSIEQRKLQADVRMFARERGREAVDKLVAVMRGVITVEIDTKRVEMFVPPLAQLAAANALLDRGYGRPHQSVEMNGRGGGPIQTEKVSAYDIIVSRLESIAQRLREDDSERIKTLKKLRSALTQGPV